LPTARCNRHFRGTFRDWRRTGLCVHLSKKRAKMKNLVQIFSGVGWKLRRSFGNRHVARTARARLRDGRSTRGLCNRRDHSEGRGADRPVCSPRWARARRSRVRRFRGARRPGVGAGAPPRHGRPPGSRSRASRPARVGRDRTTRDARGLWEASPRPRRPREGPRASRSRPTSETSLETSRRPRASAAPRGPPPPASGASGTETETNSWMTSPCSSRRRWRS
jgi:hypothetical protein